MRILLSSTILVALFAAFVSASSVKTSSSAAEMNSECSGFYTCAACTAVKTAGGSGCGWCSSTNTCEFGKASGPLFGSCSGTWDWQSSTCPAPTPVPTVTPAPTPAPPPFRPVNPGAPAWNPIGGLTGKYYNPETYGDNLTPQFQWKHRVTPSSGNGLYQIQISAGGGYVFAYRCGFSSVYLDALNASTGEVAQSVVIGQQGSSSCSGNPLPPYYDDEHQRVYVPFWGFGGTDAVVAFSVPSFTQIWSYTVNGSYPGAPYAGRPTRMMHYSPSDDSLHFLVQATQFAWVVLNGTTGKQLAFSQPFGGVSSSGGESLSFISIGDLGDGNGEVLIASLKQGLTIAAYYVKYQAVLFSGSLPLPSGQETGSVMPLQSFPGKGFYTCYSFYPSGGGTSQRQCSMFTIANGTLATIYAAPSVPSGETTYIASDSEFIYHRDSENIYEYFAENGTETGRSYTSESGANHAWKIGITKDYLFAFFTNSGQLEVWNRKTMDTVPGFSSIDGAIGSISPWDLAVYGGWFYITTGGHYYAIQIQGAA